MRVRVPLPAPGAPWRRRSDNVTRSEGDNGPRNGLSLPAMSSRTQSEWQSPRSFRLRGRSLFVIGLAVTAALALAAFLVLQSLFVQLKMKETPAQAEFFATAIDEALARLEHLPFVLSIDPQVLSALQDNDATDLNPILSDVARRSRACLLYTSPSPRDS